MTIGLFGAVVALENEAVASFHILAQDLEEAFEEAKQCLSRKKEDGELKDECRLIMVSQDLDVQDIANYQAENEVNSEDTIKFSCTCGEEVEVERGDDWEIDCPRCHRHLVANDVRFQFGTWVMRNPDFTEEHEDD